MRQRVFSPFLALAATTMAMAQSGSTPSSGALMVGDHAPAMKVAKWIKGTPLAAFEPGRVYVVEFWATWCAPCRTSIPHLSELQRGYEDRVSFNGIAVFQREPASKYLASVADYVKTMGAKMAYNVAADTAPKNGVMANAWMTAAGQDAIPTAFVVGKDGRIAWIGHPMDPALPKTLDAVLNGTFDAAGARAEAQKRAEEAKAMQTAMTAVHAAYKRGDDAKADALMHDLVARYPGTAGMILNIRYERAIERHRDAEALEIVRSGWETANFDASDLNDLAWSLLDPERFKRPDYPLAIAIATSAVEKSERKQPDIIDTLAEALFRGGRVDEAIVWAQKAVTLTDGKDEALVATLAKYKRAKGG